MKGNARLQSPSNQKAFEMYKVHHDAVTLACTIGANDYCLGEDAIPAIGVSASRGRDGTIHLTLSHCHHADGAGVAIVPPKGMVAGRLAGRVLTANAMDAHNTLDQPNKVAPAPFHGLQWREGRVVCELPPRSVAVLEQS